MRIRLRIRNKHEVNGPEFTKIIVRPYIPPVRMVFSIIGLIKEAYVEEYYDTIPKNENWNIEVILHTDEGEGLRQLIRAGWTPVD